MLHYVVLHCAMLCYAVLCYAVLCCALLRYATLRNTMIYHAMPCNNRLCMAVQSCMMHCCCTQQTFILTITSLSLHTLSTNISHNKSHGSCCQRKTPFAAQSNLKTRLGFRCAPPIVTNPTCAMCTSDNKPPAP